MLSISLGALSVNCLFLRSSLPFEMMETRVCCYVRDGELGRINERALLMEQRTKETQKTKNDEETAAQNREDEGGIVYAE